MNQLLLDQYQDVAIRSSSSPSYYSVVLGGTEGSRCNCKSYRMNPGEPCKHIIEAVNQAQRIRITYLEQREKYKGSRWFETLDTILLRLEVSDHPETSYILWLILSYLYCSKTGTSDDIYIILEGKFVNQNYRKLGLCWSLLHKQGLIRSLGMEWSKRPENKKSMLSRWELTEDGIRKVESMRGYMS